MDKARLSKSLNNIQPTALASYRPQMPGDQPRASMPAGGILGKVMDWFKGSSDRGGNPTLGRTPAAQSPSAQPQASPFRQALESAQSRLPAQTAKPTLSVPSSPGGRMPVMPGAVPLQLAKSVSSAENSAQPQGQGFGGQPIGPSLFRQAFEATQDNLTAPQKLPGMPGTIASLGASKVAETLRQMDPLPGMRSTAEGRNPQGAGLPAGDVSGAILGALKEVAHGLKAAKGKRSKEGPRTNSARASRY
jgi:hypothetical protein